MTLFFDQVPSSSSTQNTSSPSLAPAKPVAQSKFARPVLQPASAQPVVGPAPRKPALQPASPPPAPAKPLAPRSPSSSTENFISPPPAPDVPALQPASPPPAPAKLVAPRKHLLSEQELQERAGMKDTLAELASLAQTLNSETDDLNDTIQTINGKLRAFNFGIEVWCKGSDGVDFGFARLAIHPSGSSRHGGLTRTLDR